MFSSLPSPIEAILANCINQSRFDELYQRLTAPDGPDESKPIWDGKYVTKVMWVRRRLVKYNGQLFLGYLAQRPEHPLYKFAIENKPRLLAKKDAEDILRDYLTSLPESITVSKDLTDFLLALGASPNSAFKEALRDQMVKGRNRKLRNNYPFLNKVIRQRFIALGADPTLFKEVSQQVPVIL